MNGRTAKELRKQGRPAANDPGTMGLDTPSHGVASFPEQGNKTPWQNPRSEESDGVKGWPTLAHELLNTGFLSSREFLVLATLAVTAVIFIQDNIAGRLSSIHGLFFAVVKCALLVVLALGFAILYRVMALFGKERKAQEEAPPRLFWAVTIAIVTFLVVVIYLGTTWQIERDSKDQDESPSPVSRPVGDHAP